MGSDKPKRIALAFSMGIPFLELILRGIVEYGREHGPWIFEVNPEMGRIPIAKLADWEVDGIIAYLNTVEEEHAALALGIPTVNLSAAPLSPLLPSVNMDNHAVGAMAARHLLERGFRRFAYYGVTGAGYSRDRQAAFIEALQSAGFECEVFVDPVSARRESPLRLSHHRLERWLSALQPPVGLFAVHDYRARVLMEACLRVGLRIPEDVAVVGMNDDAAACEFANPPLTSISHAGPPLGRAAAALLDRLMQGKPPPARPIRFLPTSITARASTAIVAVPDAQTADAVRFMTSHIADASVATTAANVKLARRTLELRFRQWLGSSPHDYLNRLRIAKAKQLLLGQERLTIKEVAAKAGFADPRRLNAMFKRIHGRTPRDFRGQR